MLGGYLAGINWTYCFYSYLVAVVFFLFAIIYLPEPDKQQKLATEDSNVKTKKVPGSVYLISLVFAFFFLFMYIIITNAAIVIMGEKLGTPGQIGIAFSFLTLTSFITSAALGNCSNVLSLSFFRSPIFLVQSGSICAIRALPSGRLHWE